MKKIIIFSVLLVFSVVFTAGCGKQNDSVAETQQTQQTTETQNNIEIAPQTAINTLAEILNEGYSIADKSKVYIYRSKDFNKAYFIGTVIKNGSQLYNCVWVTNDKDYLSNIYSMNNFAENASGIMQGSQTKAAFSVHDDGYHQINSKVLGDMKS